MFVPQYLLTARFQKEKDGYWYWLLHWSSTSIPYDISIPLATFLRISPFVTYRDLGGTLLLMFTPVLLFSETEQIIQQIVDLVEKQGYKARIHTSDTPPMAEQVAELYLG